MTQYQLNKQKMRYQKKFKMLGLLFSLLTTLFVNVGASAFDLITPSGIKKIPNNKYLIINGSQSNKPQKKVNINQNGIKKRTTMVSSCIRKNRYNTIINEASRQYNVNKQLIQAIISTESCFNPNAVSPKGAQGLMQLMPFTAKRFGVNDSFDPAQNIIGGVKYLRFLLKRFRGEASLAIAAYNAGEGAVDHYAGIPPYKETRNYVKKVLALFGQKNKQIFKKSEK